MTSTRAEQHTAVQGERRREPQRTATAETEAERLRRLYQSPDIPSLIFSGDIRLPGAQRASGKDKEEVCGSLPGEWRGNPAYDSRDTDNLNWQEERPSAIGENKGSGRQQAQLQKIGQDNVNFFA